MLLHACVTDEIIYILNSYDRDLFFFAPHPSSGSNTNSEGITVINGRDKNCRDSARLTEKR